MFYTCHYTKQFTLLISRICILNPCLFQLIYQVKSNKYKNERPDQTWSNKGTPILSNIKCAKFCQYFGYIYILYNNNDTFIPKAIQLIDISIHFTYKSCIYILYTIIPYAEPFRRKVARSHQLLAIPVTKDIQYVLAIT